MKRMFVLISHTMTQHQQQDAMRTLEVTQFEVLPTDIWSQIPVEFDSVESALVFIKQDISLKKKSGDYLFVQGDYGATYSMVQFAKEIDIIPVYATTQRLSRDIVNGEKITTTREFKHVRFRKY